MILAETPPILDSRTAVVSTLDGVTTALVAFVLVGLILPHIIKKPRQFYMIVASIMLLIVLHMLTLMLQRPGFTVFAGALTGVIQLIAFGLAVMSTGGLGAKQLAGELARSYEVMRRGEETKEVIIPIEGQPRRGEKEADRVVYTIDTQTEPANPPGPAKPPPGTGTIPLE